MFSHYHLFRWLIYAMFNGDGHSLFINSSMDKDAGFFPLGYEWTHLHLPTSDYEFKNISSDSVWGSSGSAYQRRMPVVSMNLICYKRLRRNQIMPNAHSHGPWTRWNYKCFQKVHVNSIYFTWFPALQPFLIGGGKKNIQKYSIHHPNPSLRAAGLFLCQALEGDPILHGQVGYGGIVAGGIHQWKQDFHSRPPNLCIVVRCCGFAFQCTYCTSNVELSNAVMWPGATTRSCWQKFHQYTVNVSTTLQVLKNMGRETVSLLNSNFHGPLTRWPCSQTQKTYIHCLDGEQVLPIHPIPIMFPNLTSANPPLWPVAARSAAVGASRCRGGNPLRCLDSWTYHVRPPEKMEKLTSSWYGLETIWMFHCTGSIWGPL